MYIVNSYIYISDTDMFLQISYSYSFHCVLLLIHFIFIWTLFLIWLFIRLHIYISHILYISAENHCLPKGMKTIFKWSLTWMWLQLERSQGFAHGGQALYHSVTSPVLIHRVLTLPSFSLLRIPTTSPSLPSWSLVHMTHILCWNCYIFYFHMMLVYLL